MNSSYCSKQLKKESSSKKIIEENERVKNVIEMGEKLKKENEILKKENKELKKENEILKKENEELQQQLSKGYINTLKESPESFYFLKRYTQLKSLSLIVEYQRNDEVTGEMLFKIVKDKKNIMFVITSTSGNVFGSFHSKIPQRMNSYVPEDNQMFVFSLKNSNKTGEICFTPRETNHHLLFFPKEKDELFYILGCWDIKTNDCVIDSVKYSGKHFFDCFNAENCFEFEKENHFQFVYVRVYQWNN
ncbi:hypothetical protein EDI_252800 [Entamoeba dispar SAW760]|uniref:TLDc domain-containing protein n=1 Tax=Entamoeba dispar (strain ATCC PRA-260 / SAW760) TaxID=370354 RepID=B0EF85_ENTDS|nr:uncharacterized protein EDI_252800 [Entamoeba dispar SAW760]EDR26815.1 hypothetical protein EDI_252800 [Entamoeba dispar SAW760]|eukprot:EDR26815.1 hypothetical protein EDI_252800 [Entamoeba dispar SAW760]